MTVFGTPGLSLAITPLKNAGPLHFAVHVIDAPFPGIGDLHDCVLNDSLCQLWQNWQEMFSSQQLPPYPSRQTALPDMPADPNQPGGLAVRLMQNLGIHLWQWLFDGPILATLNRSQGIAIGQVKPLRLRLEVRDPNLIALPWEIMQDAAGRQAIALMSENIWFSRTTSDVNALPPLRSDYALRILLVLGQATDPASGTGIENNPSQTLKLEQEAAVLAQTLRTSGNSGIKGAKGSPCQVDILVQPTPAELIRALETRVYNLFFYAGHGAPGPDGGMIYVRPDMTLNGTELAQVLTRCQVKLAVFNACWGAQPDHYTPADPGTSQHRAHPIPRSSLAEVLIHHGVPAVLGMRDVIADHEAISFIEEFAKSLAERKPIDQAVAVARQHLLTLYRFNQQAWTLPVLYMHPEFNGELLKAVESNETGFGSPELFTQIACLRSLTDGRVWQVRGGLMRIGRDISKNDLVLKEDESGVSRDHALILRRDNPDDHTEAIYFLKDFSRFGTWVLSKTGWQKIHHQEVLLTPGSQVKFGSSQNEALEFVIFSPSDAPPV
jgi:hypothetical protein